MFHIIGQIVFGLIIGAIAQFLLPGKDFGTFNLTGLLITCAIGIGGSLLGTFIGRAIWGNEKYAAGWIMSIAGAILLLVIYRILF